MEKNMKNAILSLQILCWLFVEMIPTQPSKRALQKMSDQELMERIRTEQGKGNYLSIYTNEHHRRYHSAPTERRTAS
jgi:hypothetical protein